MQAIVLAAGLSSRMYPFALGGHKSLIEIMGKPILEYTLSGLKDAGIKDIILVVGPKENIQSYFGNGEKLSVKLTYVVQPEALGMGDGLLRAKDLIKGDFIILHGHHVDIFPLTKKLLSAKKGAVSGVLLAEARENTWDYGVLKTKGSKVEDLVEKPAKGRAPSNLCVIGVYCFSKTFLEELKNTPSEHYQLEKAIATFAKKNTVSYVEAKEDVVTLKYPWDILSVKNYLLKKITGSLGKKASIAKSAEIIGPVVIEDGATIMEGVRIKGPCYIGKNVTIGNHALLRGGVDVEEGSTVGAYMEVKNTLIMKGTETHSGFIGDSVIGKNCKIAARFSTANVRLDRDTVKVDVKGRKIDTGYKHLGVMIGDEARLGIHVTVMPGIMIGKGAIIGPSTTVLRNVADSTRYYTKFQEIVEEK